MSSRRFQVRGEALITRVNISAAARKQLQNITLSLDDKALKDSLSSVNQSIRGLGSSFNTLGNNTFGARLSGEMVRVSNATQSANKELRKQELLLVQVLRKASAFRLAAIAINTFVDSIKGSFLAFIKFDSYLRDINKVAKLNDAELTGLGISLIKLAGAYNITATEALSSFRTISQLGVGDINEQLKVYEMSLQIAASSTLDLEGAINLLVSTSQQANLTLEQSAVRIAQLSALEDASAVDIKDLAAITSRAGTSIAQAFNSAAEAAGLFAAVQERTRAGGAVVGTFAKTFIARLSGANEDVISALKSLNIEISDTSNRLKDPIQLLLELKGALRGLGEEDAGAIIGKVFGVRQIELGKAALDSLGNEILKNGRAFKLAEATATGYVAQLFKIQQEQNKFETQVTQMKNSLLAFFASAGNDTIAPLLQKLIGLGNLLNKVFGDIGTQFSTVFNTASVGALAFIARNAFNLKAQTKSNAELRSDTVDRFGGLLPSDRPPRAIITRQSVISSKDPIDAIRQKLRTNQAFTLPGITTPIRGIGVQDPLSPSGARRVGSSTSFESRFVRGREGTANVREMGKLFGTVKELNSGFVKFKAGLSRFGNKFNQTMEAFSGRALVAGLALSTTGDVITRFGKSLDSATGDIVAGLGKITATFGTFLPFGAKVATAAATIDAVTFAFKEISIAVRAAQGDFESLAAIAGKRGDKESEETFRGAAFSNRLIKELNSGTLSEPNKVFVEKFSQIVNTIISSVQFIEDPARRAQEALTQLGGVISELEQITPGARNAILGQTDIGSDGKLFRRQGLLGSEQFLSKLNDKALASQIGKSVSARLSDTNVASDLKAFSDAISIITEDEKLLFEARRKNKVLSDDELDKLEQEFKLRQELAKSVVDLNGAQRFLINTQRGLGELDTLKEELRLREEIRQTNLSGLRESLRLEQERKQIVEIERQRSLREEIAAKRLDFSRQSGGQRFTSDLSSITTSSPETRQALVGIILEVEKLEESLQKAIKNELTDREALEKLRKRVAAAENEATAERLRDTQKLVELERKLANERLKSFQDLQSSFQSFGQVQMRTISTLDQMSDLEQSRLETDLIEGANLLRIDGLRAEIELLRDLNKKGRDSALASLGESLKDKISIIGDTIFPKSGALKTKADFDMVEQFEKLWKEPLQDTDEIKKKFHELAKLLLKASEDSINSRLKEIQLEKQLAQERFASVAALINKTLELKQTVKSTFEAQKGLSDAIRSKLDEAASNIKSKRSDLSDALSSLKDARQAMRNALVAAAENSVDYGLALARANIEAQKILGVFYGFKDQAAALDSVFQSAISNAQALGVSEQQLAKLRTEAAQQQLDLFSQLLNEQRSKAQTFFTSSAEDRIKFVQGLSAVQSIVGQFGGNIENFRGLNESQLNDFGRQLIALPQDLRQTIMAALDQLPNGVGIGGFTVDQIREILQGGALGESSALGIDPLSELIQTVADLTIKSVELDTQNLITNQEQLNEARAAVQNAKDQVLFAKLALVQAQQDALKIQSAIREVTGAVNANIAEYKESIRAQTNEIVNSNKSAAQKQEALAELLIKSQQTINSVLSNAASQVSSVGPDFRMTQQVGAQPTGGSAGAEILGGVLKEFSANLNNFNTSVDGFSINQKALAQTMGDAAAQLQNLTSKIETVAKQKLEEIKVTITNDQRVSITGAAEAAQEILRAIEQRGFVTQEDINNLRVTIDKVIAQLISNGTLRPVSGLSR